MLYAGLDIHKRVFQVVVLDPDSGRQALQPRRPHRALELQPPEAIERSAPGTGTIERRDLLGGLIHEYKPAAA